MDTYSKNIKHGKDRTNYRMLAASKEGKSGTELERA